MGCDFIERILLIMADILRMVMTRRVNGRAGRGGGGSSAAAPGTGGPKLILLSKIFSRRCNKF